MSKFNRPVTRAAVSSPVKSEQTPTGRTFEGAPGFARDAKGELFLLAVTNLVGEDTFYERAKNRDDRYVQLVRHLAVDDPDWTAGLLEWLRGEGNMRSASIVGAAEYVHARLESAGARERRTHEAGQGPGAAVFGGDSLTYQATANRRVIDSVLQRADEPGEILAYWTSKYGRNLPKPVKRGVADAVARLYTERNLAKYDTATTGYRFGDVIDLVHPIAGSHSEAWAAWQGDLFAHALDRRHGRDNPIPETLGMLRARAELLALPAGNRRAVLNDPQRLKDAGITWEALAGWLQGPMDAAAWSAVIPSMGYMALLRNLRNFDQAGVSDKLAEQVAAKLADPEQVARSRQLPMRFLSAYRAAPSLRWAHPLDKALTASIGNIPALKGRTLILVDTSSSMNAGFSKDGTLMRWDAAALFGISLAQRCEQADVVSFSSARYYFNDAPGVKTKEFPLRRGESLLKSIDRWKDGGYFLGGGTDTAAALRQHFAGHTRVVILTDEQASGEDVGGVIPQTTPLVTFNLAGYERGHAPSGSGLRVAIGGLTDAGFRVLSMLERGRSADWPWVSAG
jgi:hypothetical protein